MVCLFCWAFGPFKFIKILFQDIDRSGLDGRRVLYPAVPRSEICDRLPITLVTTLPALPVGLILIFRSAGTTSERDSRVSATFAILMLLMLRRFVPAVRRISFADVAGSRIVLRGLLPAGRFQHASWIEPPGSIAHSHGLVPLPPDRNQSCVRPVVPGGSGK